MILFPAIDLKDGACVRLKRGEMESATIFNPDPAAQARAFESAGFEWLHCVDLNGAFEGRSVNGGAIKAIQASVSLPIQLGGGIRDRAAIDFWLTNGIARVILGTMALRDPQLVRDAARDYPGRIAVGIDARDGKVSVEGWAETSEITALELAQRFQDAGVAAIIFTDIGRDGMLAGPSLEATDWLAKSINIPVIASGGIANLSDIQNFVLLRNPNILGVVIGRALYDGRISPAAALCATIRH